MDYLNKTETRASSKTTKELQNEIIKLITIIEHLRNYAYTLTQDPLNKIHQYTVADKIKSIIKGEE